MDIISRDRIVQIVSKFDQLDSLMVVGDIGIDKYTLGDVVRISPEAPVPVVKVIKQWQKLGLAANISHNLQTLEVKSTLCGVVGDDLNGIFLKELVEKNDLSTEGLVKLPNRETTFKERVTTNVQQICRVDYESIEALSKEDEKQFITKIESLSDRHNSLILEDYSKGALTENVIKSVISSFKNSGKLITVDPGRKTNPLFYKGATLFKPNLSEAEKLVDELGYKRLELSDMANVLADKLDLTMLVITLGSKGMALIDRNGDGKIKIIPTFATEVFDVSGAGDTSISLITASLAAGANLEEAAWIGNCGAGVVVGKKGTATVTVEELLKHYDRIVRNIL